MMKDVSQCEEDGGLALQLPLRAFLLHQSTFLWWGEGIGLIDGRTGEEPQLACPEPGSPQGPAPH